MIKLSHENKFLLYYVRSEIHEDKLNEVKDSMSLLFDENSQNAPSCGRG